MMPQDDSTSAASGPYDADEESGAPELPASHEKRRSWSQIWETLLRLGLGEVALRMGTGLASIVLILLAIWVMSNFYLKGPVIGSQEVAALAAPLPTATRPVKVAALQAPENGSRVFGIVRRVEMHTSFPARPRFDVTKYTVQKGDTITGIAEKYNLKPSTILLGNYYTLADNPHMLYPGQELNILPADGLLYEWHEGDGLNGVAEFYGVKAEDIVNWPGNHLNPDTLGEWSHPNIASGTWLFVPNGMREFVSFSAPRITRENPSVAKLMGPGACGQISDGPIGTGAFIWPAPDHYLSGFDYSPETNHRGIDIAGSMGNAIFAADGGVVVYAGWNDWGYGNVVVIDHGTGWQTLYAHLSALNVGCGSYVYQGDIIAAMGSTGKSSGPHLHFEMLGDAYGKANPWNFLPAP